MPRVVVTELFSHRAWVPSTAAPCMLCPVKEQVHEVRAGARAELKTAELGAGSGRSWGET